MTCAQCGAGLDDGALHCAACQRLVHAARLEGLAAEARAAEGAKRWKDAAAKWREALPLLPDSIRQHATVSEKLAAAELAAAAAEEERKGIGKWVAALGPLGFFLWKFKALLLIAATKGKLLLLGLTKLSTLSSMLLSLGFYWGIYGWWFALGIILSIYIHEMGHVSELRRFGIPATAPMFIPGLGAFIRMNARPATVGQEARVGLAGPNWGAMTAVACAALYFATGTEIWKALARWGAWINLFNLTPIWQLDGGHAFKAMTRRHRLWVVIALAAMWIWTEDMLMLIVGAVGAFRLFSNDYPETEDPPITVNFVLLVLTLGLLCLFEIAQKS
jgi:Zn-dependent protease/uncharacterized Zn finger protein (UPF0148 family)